MIRRPPRSTLSSSSAASDVYKRQANRCSGRISVVVLQLGIKSTGKLRRRDSGLRSNTRSPEHSERKAPYHSTIFSPNGSRSMCKRPLQEDLQMARGLFLLNHYNFP
eukprot:TRINITY_DN36504_c0_g1_i1.p2 TRINITY_DN36504_c0_g1~~TRINITY_DN36504_c0_g1_i1.p2  ORF type:complete len:107 (-),score=1.66 TRINITY_DN36504_c0_g1_i1:451-771(-)